MLTAKDAIADRVRGLDAGADDYLVKPFSLDELMARVRALRRRTAPSDDGQRDRPLVYDDLELDTASRIVTRGSRELQLTPREFDLLDLFMRNPNIVLSRNQIMERVWGASSWSDSNVLEVFIGNLRKEMEAAGEPRLIQTVRGIGYSLRRVRGSP
jgi:two-component system response regulator MprA